MSDASSIDGINKLPPTPEELLEERERAIALLSFLPETKTLTLYCQRTGVPIATMNLLQQAGKLPFLSQWKETQSFHPLFSLPQAQLLSWTRKNWNNIFRSSALDSVTPLQREQFCISFMAILHSLGSLDQTIPALPEFRTVIVNMQRLLELAYWYNYLDSKRFRFPTLRISKLNANATLGDIGTYFDICDSVRHDWENSRDAKLEDSKLEAARKAEKAVRGTHVKAVSKKALWNWFLSSVASSNSKKYNLPEWMEWKEDAAKLFFANENQQLSYTADDVQAIEDVFIAECTLGTTVSHAFTSELDKIRNHIINHQKIFEIDWEATYSNSNVKRVGSDGLPVSTATIENSPPAEPGKEPQLNDYNSRSAYVQAKARYDIACRQYSAWIDKYGKDDGNKEGSEQS